MGGDVIFTQFYSGIFDVFGDERRTKRDTAKWMAVADSAHQIGPTILWREPLRALGGVHGW